MHRNLDPFPFPSHMTEAQREQTFQTITSSILPHLKHGKALTHKELTPHAKEFLFEHFILSEGFEQFDPGRGMIVDDSCAFLGLINVEDHIHIHLFEKSRNWDEAYTKLSHLDSEIGRSMEFAFSDRFGHLTSDPMVCGTGLVVQTFLHCPALIHTGKFTDSAEELGHEVTIRGLGQEDEFIADLVLIENKFKLGVSEPDILKVVHTAALMLAEKEEKARKDLKNDGITEVKDMVCRAFGILKHAHTLHIEETLTSLSLFELGKDLGWVQGADDLSFKKSFFSTRRAHLHHDLNEDKSLPKDELILKRASLIQEKLKSSTIKM